MSNQNRGNRNNKLRNRNSNTKNRPKPKMVEENVPERDLNQADLPRRVEQSNDPSWYMQNLQLGLDAGSLSYSNVLGLPLLNGSNVDIVTDTPQVIPGICAIDFTPTIGHSVDSTSAVNRTILILWSYIRSRISGSRKYDPIDVMFYDLAFDSAYMWWTTLCRVYGVMTNFSVQNRYMPRTLVEAMGFNYDDLILDLPGLRSIINLFAKRLGAFCIPAGMSYNTRHAWMCANIFTDAQSAKAQMYLYNPTAGYIYTPQTGATPKLVLNNLPNKSGAATLKMIEMTCNEIAEPLLASESFGNISGDILNAFGSGNLLRTAQIDENFSVEPIYSPEVLSQIENLEMVTNPQISDIDQVVNIAENCITQTVKVPTWTNNMTGQSGLYADNGFIVLPHVLNMHTSPVDAGMNFVATRGMIGTTKTVHTGDNNTAYGATWDVDAFGSEIFTSARIFRNIHYTGSELPNHVWRFTTDMFSGEGIEASDMLQFIKDWVAFDWAPKVRLWDANQIPGTAETVTLDLNSPVMDYDNVTTLDNEQLKRMHEVALLSLFNVTNIGEYSGN